MIIDQQEGGTVDCLIVYPDYPAANPAVPISEVRERVTIRASTTLGRSPPIQATGDQEEN